MKKSVKIILIVLCMLLLALFIGWVLWANTALEKNQFMLTEANLPDEFDGLRIAHVSDLHSAEMGKGNVKLIGMLKEMQPDIIMITGDLMDCRDTETTVALAFAREAVMIAPCYYVTGNHEVRLPADLYSQLMDGLTSAGVTVLMDEAAQLIRGDESITIVGQAWGDADVCTNTDLNGYSILLAHTPEFFDLYAEAGFDLVLSGHNHGGQFRLPFVGGLYTPGQGLFPAYDAGHYTQGNTDLIVSRGIGNSTFPFRFNNRPEVILIELKCT